MASLLTMDRIEIEITLNRERAWLIERYAAMPSEDLTRPVTSSHHDPSAWWTPKDHRRTSQETSGV